MLNEKELLLNQGTIGNHIFKNRYIVAPMTRVSSSQNGEPNETVRRYYERFAKGGFSAIISEGIYPDREHSQGYEYQPGLASHEQMEAWKPIVETVHENRSLFIAQLMHAGLSPKGMLIRVRLWLQAYSRPLEIKWPYMVDKDLSLRHGPFQLKR